MKNRFIVKGSETTILLNRNDGSVLETFIDTRDLPLATNFPNTWYASWNPPTQSFYVYGKQSLNGRRKTVQLHRWLTSTPDISEVDHVNLDTLDNRRSNLRIASSAENAQNKRVNRRNNKSGYRGVSWCNTNRKWIAQVMVDRKNKFLGYFDEKHVAGRIAAEARAVMMPYSKEAT
ncbi:HNH endonuclease [Cohnella suwonensis]|uniref:HNH endonuclease n=1 Tax=Cohnella suwonensis TaxID=696072 RepID=A0ABW0LRR0_9BACL